MCWKIIVRSSTDEIGKEWWRGMDSNHRRQSRQIYSLIPLATREPLRRFHFAARQRQKTCAILRMDPHLGKRFPKIFFRFFVIYFTFGLFISSRARKLLLRACSPI